MRKRLKCEMFTDDTFLTWSSYAPVELKLNDFLKSDIVTK